MGYDATCTLKSGGKSFRGTASLEQKDLIFRGDTRLAIPLAAISAATARDGTLHVTFGDRSVDFLIGRAAEKWAKRITNPPSRLDKLGVKEGMTIAAIGIAEAAFLDEAAARAAKVLRQAPRGTRRADLIFYGANHRDALPRLAALSRQITPSGAIWVVRPKGQPAITEAETMAAGRRAGLVDVKVVSFSDTHSAEKFVIPVSKRR
jgi:hypothetical protein